jgi:dTDP-glucose 4,6-dehydratase
MLYYVSCLFHFKEFMSRTILVTGGAGFIGSNFVHYALAQDPQLKVVVLDKLTYAGSLLSIDEALRSGRCVHELADIADEAAVERIFASHAPQAVVNFAAETHVDRSIDSPKAFIETNFVGVFVLLERSRQHLKSLDEAGRKAFRFLQVSTDEVYGSLAGADLFREDTLYAPNSPYSASKAGADHLLRAYYHTYGLPCLVTNCSNNYGPYQFPEKLIPLVILNALEAKDLPIYGDGGNIRDWLHVQDHCKGIWLALEKGRLGEKYNIGGNNERSNMQVVSRICGELEHVRPAKANPAMKARGVEFYSDLITFVPDRPGHDRRYAIDASKIRKELGWTPGHDFESGITQTVAWYAENLEWCRVVQEGKYQRQRLGVKA